MTKKSEERSESRIIDFSDLVHESAHEAQKVILDKLKNVDGPKRWILYARTISYLYWVHFSLSMKAANEEIEKREKENEKDRRSGAV